MCGIIGYIGQQNAAPILLDGLQKLEYRGYDSAGLAVFDQDQIHIRRCEGKIKRLADMVNENPVSGKLGIGHTRWATHGRPSHNNAHPHFAGDVAVVHNGIIENYLELKQDLLQAGREFTSETDSEIIAHQIDRKYKQGAPFEDAVRLALGELVGSYALAIIHHKHPGLLIAARRESPLVVGYGDGEHFIASDIPAILSYTDRVSYLEDGELAFLTPSRVTYSDLSARKIDKEIHQVLWDPVMAQKAGYKHFMLKEIHEQPQAVIDTFRGRISFEKGEVLQPDWPFSEKEIKRFEKVTIVACGTSYHAGLVGKFLIEQLARMPVEVDLASEFRYRDPLLDEKTLLVLISQSGETADTLAALREGQGKGACSLGICNVVGSSLARATDGITYTQAGPEIGVASTKAFTTQLVSLYLMAIYLGRIREALTQDQSRTLITELTHLPHLLEEALEKENEIKKVSEQFYGAQSFLYLGRGLNYPLALEGALKLKEISYIHAEGYPAGEMKHGPIALINEHMPVVVAATRGKTLEKILSNIEQVGARSGRVIALTEEDNEAVIRKAEAIIPVPAASELLMPIVLALPLQLLAYHIAVLRGTDVDQPRNLAKSVTVE